MNKILTLICSAAFLAGCHHRHVVSCTNNNSIFAQYSPDDVQYKSELVQQLRKHDPKKMHYYIEKYVERNGKPFMFVAIESDSLCAQVVLDIKNENKLKEYKNVKGLTYNGAEIQGMQFGIDSTYGSYRFLFEEGVIVK